MANRVALGKLGDGVTYGLEISAPGYDVLTTTQNNIIFSTRWGHAGSVILSGNLACSTVEPGAGNPGSYVTIPFGTTLEYVPIALVYLTTNSVGRRATSLIESGLGLYVARDRPQYRVYSDRIEIYNQKFASNDNIRYVVLRIPGGQ